MRQFLKDFFRIPNSNGERRLVKNYFTGKLIWTKGSEPSNTKTKKEDFSKEKNVYVNGQSLNKKTNLSHISNTISYEPLKNNRFIVNFSDIEPYFIQSYHFLGNSNNKIDNDGRCHSIISIVLPLSPVLALEDRLITLEGKNIGEVKINFLDATGEEVRTMILSDVVVEKVEMLNYLDYSKDEILKAYVNFSHANKKILIPKK